MYSSHRSDTQSSDDEVRVSKKLKSDTLAAAALLSMWDKSGSNQPMSKPNSPQPNGTISGPGMVPFDDRVERRAHSPTQPYSSPLNSKCVEAMHKSQTEQVGAVPQGAAVSGPSCAEQAEVYPPSFVTPSYRPTMLSEEIRPIITGHHTPQSVTRTLPMSTSELARGVLNTTSVRPMNTSSQFVQRASPMAQINPRFNMVPDPSRHRHVDVQYCHEARASPSHTQVKRDDMPGRHKFFSPRLVEPTVLRRDRQRDLDIPNSTGVDERQSEEAKIVSASVPFFQPITSPVRARNFRSSKQAHIKQFIPNSEQTTQPQPPPFYFAGSRVRNTTVPQQGYADVFGGTHTVTPRGSADVFGGAHRVTQQGYVDVFGVTHTVPPQGSADVFEGATTGYDEFSIGRGAFENRKPGHRTRSVGPGLRYHQQAGPIEYAEACENIPLNQPDTSERTGLASMLDEIKGKIAAFEELASKTSCMRPDHMMDEGLTVQKSNSVPLSEAAGGSRRFKPVLQEKSPPKNHKRRRKTTRNEELNRSSSTSSSDEDVSSHESEISIHSRSTARVIPSRHSPKIPPFTGQGDTWKVWLNRFNDVAQRWGWSTEDKLNELLPRLQGQAGDFVYGQLNPHVRGSFKMLTKELECRFRKVETTGTFRTQFSHRRQKMGESVEIYAAELKRIYDKAYPDRDRKTRQEDLLRRFLEGLQDDNARHLVEYVKSPGDVDEAVYEVVNFVDSRRRSSTSESRKQQPQRRVAYAQYVNGGDSDQESEYFDEECRAQVVRAVGRPPKNRQVKEDQVTPTAEAQDQPVPVQMTGNKAPASSDVKKMEQTLDQLKKSIKQESTQTGQLLKTITEQIQLLVAVTSQRQSDRDAAPKKATRGPVVNSQPVGRQNWSSRPYQRDPVNRWDGQRNSCCYRCGKDGHFARDCWTFMGQVQMSGQAGCQTQEATPGSHPNSQGSYQVAGDGSNQA